MGQKMKCLFICKTNTEVMLHWILNVLPLNTQTLLWCVPFCHSIMMSFSVLYHFQNIGTLFLKHSNVFISQNISTLFLKCVFKRCHTVPTGHCKKKQHFLDFCVCVRRSTCGHVSLSSHVCLSRDVGACPHGLLVGVCQSRVSSSMWVSHVKE